MVYAYGHFRTMQEPYFGTSMGVSCEIITSIAKALEKVFSNLTEREQFFNWYDYV